MNPTTDPVARNEWIVCGCTGECPVGHRLETQILGQPISIHRTGESTYSVSEINPDGSRGRALPAQISFGCVFTSLGEPTRPLPSMPEFDEPDRAVANCGKIRVNTSPYRVIENFLDMAHFSFIHAGLLGAVEETEVFSYRTQHRKDIDEIWAEDCPYIQPQGAYSPSAGESYPSVAMTLRSYRIMSPFSASLTKVSHKDNSRKDLTTIFVQPLTETSSLAYTPIAFVGAKEEIPARVAFQLTIFMQDRIVLENQMPALFPLDPTYELPTRADATSIAYRRWLKAMNMKFGIFEKQAAA